MKQNITILLLLSITGLSLGSRINRRQGVVDALTTTTITVTSGAPNAVTNTPLFTLMSLSSSAVGAPPPPPSQAGAQGTGIIVESMLMTAGIVQNAQPPGAATVGVAQPPAVSNTTPVNSATLQIAGIVGGSAAVATSSSIAASGQGTVNSATLMTAGIVQSSQPGSEATVGIPQPAAASGVTEVNSATLSTADIIAAATATTGAGGSSTVNATASLTVPKNMAELRKPRSMGRMFGLVAAIILFL